MDNERQQAQVLVGLAQVKLQQGLLNDSFAFLEDAKHLLDDDTATKIMSTIHLQGAYIQASLGRLEQGYAADIIALAKDPLGDIHELKKVVFVMRDGVVYKKQW